MKHFTILLVLFFLFQSCEDIGILLKIMTEGNNGDSMHHYYQDKELERTKNLLKQVEEKQKFIKENLQKLKDRDANIHRIILESEPIDDNPLGSFSIELSKSDSIKFDNLDSLTLQIKKEIDDNIYRIILEATPIEDTLLDSFPLELVKSDSLSFSELDSLLLEMKKEIDSLKN